MEKIINVQQLSITGMFVVCLLILAQVFGVPVAGLAIGGLLCAQYVAKRDVDGFIFLWLVIFPAGFFSYYVDVISLKEVFAIGVILLYLNNKSLFSPRNGGQRKMVHYVGYLCVFLFLFTVGHSIRCVLLHFRGYETRSIGNAVSIFFKGFVYYYSIYLVCIRMLVGSPIEKRAFFYAILGSCLIQSIGLFFPSFFFNINTAFYELEDMSTITANSRMTPLWSLTGGANTFAAYMAMVFAFIVMSEVKIKFSLFFAFLLLGSTLATLSRSGFGAIGIVLFFYVLSSFSGRSSAKNIFYILIAFCLLYFAFTERIDMLFERFSEISNEINRDSDMIGRAAILYEYIDYMNKNTMYYLTGAMKELGFTFVPHNMFFTSIYYNGVFPLVLLLISIIGFFRILKYEHKYLILAILSSFVFTEYFHSEIGEAFALLFLVCIYKDYHTQNI